MEWDKVLLSVVLKKRKKEKKVKVLLSHTRVVTSETRVLFESRTRGIFLYGSDVAK